MKKMKKNFIFLYLVATSVMLVAPGCKKGYFDINTNPNSPTEVPARFLLSSALVNSARQMEAGNLNFANYWMGYWCPSGDFIPDNNLLTYNVTTDFQTGNWSGNYITLRNYKDMITQGSADPKLVYYKAIGRVMWAFHFAHIVDLYNNAIYSEYGIPETTLFPKYDNGSDIYVDLLSQLDGAIADIAGASPEAENPGDFDVMFGGEMQEWQQLANNLKVKLLLHLSNNTSLASIVSAGFAGIDQSIGFFTGNAKINPGFSNASDANQNPKWASNGFEVNGAERQGYRFNRACKFAVDYMKNNGDDRLSFFYKPNSEAEVKGRVFGSSATAGLEGNSFISAIGSGVLKSVSQDAYIMPSYQIHFLLAEAYQRGFLTGDAKATYEGGVQASFDLLGAGSAFSILNGGYATWDNANDPLELIYLQGWVAANGIDPLESYTTWRRTGYPEDLPVSIYPGVNATHIPYRLAYPTAEYSFNAASVNAQGTIEPLNSKIFWMP
jgi:hypothetical protein